MPPKRPQSHVNADRSIVKITEPFLSAGWSVEELDKDYGEDLLVRLFSNDEATPYSFFVQAKSSKRVAELKTIDARYIQYPIDHSHLDHWNNFWEPVILIIWDAVGDNVYWEIVQSPEKSIEVSDRHAQIYIPIDNSLDADGLTRIASRTKARHQRFEQERQGAQVLVDMLEESLDIKIDYNPQYGLLIVTKSSGEMQVTAFGKYREAVERLAKSTSLSPEKIVNESIVKYAEISQALQKSNTTLIITDSAENVVSEWSSMEELDRTAQRSRELHEE